MAKNIIISAFVGKKRVKCAGANYGIQNLIYTCMYSNFARILQKIFVSARDRIYSPHSFTITSSTYCEI
jgi:hypothetical protein